MTATIPEQSIFRVVLLLLTVIPLSGCSPGVRSMATGAASGASTSTSGIATGKLMVFGGADHKTYLGCLNCSQYATDSVLNQYGQHGSRYSTQSIWNHYSEYGSAYSMYGACNAYSTDPPVIVDNAGNYYGRLTLNTYHVQLGTGARYYNWLKQSVCELD